MKGFLNSRLVITIIVIAFLVFAAQWGYNKYVNLQTELRISQQNESAMKDSLRFTKNKLKQSEFSKQILVAQNVKDLKQLNEKMYNQLSKLDGKISSLTSTIVKLQGQIDSLDTEVIDLEPADSNGIAKKAFTWSYEKTFDEDNYRKISGQTAFEIDTSAYFKPLKTSITDDIIRFQLTQGLRTTDDGKVEMFATSNYPGFEIEELNSVLIDPDTHPALSQFSKRKRFSLGLYGGFGGTINLSNSTIIFGPQFGLGGTWRLIGD